MGLAASQARFLAITSRKANCEFRSMEIAQDKLSVTRELAKVSENYQNALNQTTLLWDYDGSGQDLFNLSYGVLMAPTTLNNFTPYLITNRAGAVVLNGQMAKAAEAICPDGTPGVKSAGGFRTFMEALGAAGVLPLSAVKTITNLTDIHYIDSANNTYTNLTPEEIAEKGVTIDNKYPNAYNPSAGYGAEPLNKNGATANNVIGLAYSLGKADLGGASDLIADYLTRCDVIYINGTKANDQAKKELTLQDLLTKDVVAVQIYNDGKHTIYNPAKGTGDSYGVDTDGDGNSDVTENVGEINGLGLDADTGLFTTLTKALESLLATDAVSKAAFDKARITTIDQFMDMKIISDKKVSEDTVKSTLKSEVDKNNQIVFYQNSKDSYNSGVAINLSNMVGYLLTQFENILNGYELGYFAGPTMNSSNFVTDDMSYNFVIKDKDAVTSEDLLKADFYMQIYNNICSNGWTVSEKIDVDQEYLEQMLKNGNYFIASLSQDGYFYQGRYNELDCVVEVKDQDAIAQAEAEFTTLKAKLTYKEDRLDVEMKNLDAEISALTTEYDSVKGLISKNVEKVFQLFQ